MGHRRTEQRLVIELTFGQAETLLGQPDFDSLRYAGAMQVGGMTFTRPARARKVYVNGPLEDVLAMAPVQLRQIIATQNGLTYQPTTSEEILARDEDAIRRKWLSDAKRERETNPDSEAAKIMQLRERLTA